MDEPIDAQRTPASNCSPGDQGDSCNNSGNLAAQWHELCDAGSVVPDVDQFLAGHPAISLSQLVEVLLVDQRCRWCGTPGPRVEEYLLKYPALGQDQQRVFDLVYGEMLARWRLGFSPEVNQVMARFPELSGLLQRQLEVACWMPGQRGARREESARRRFKRRVGEYEVLRVIAKGGMGMVYKAKHVSLERLVALKMLAANRAASTEDLARFATEVRITAQLDHPNVIPLFEAGEHEGTPFYTMRLVARGSLTTNRKQFLGRPRQIAETMLGVVRAVDHAHSHGILHRDLKPSNVLIDAAGQPYLVDFGLAKLLDDTTELTQSGDLLGSLPWLSPEQASGTEGRATFASDIYGLGAILYFLLFGQIPPACPDSASYRQRLPAWRPRSPQRVDPHLEQICAKALHRDPEQRYATAGAMARDLHDYLAGKAIVAWPLHWWWKWRAMLMASNLKR